MMEFNSRSLWKQRCFPIVYFKKEMDTMQRTFTLKLLSCALTIGGLSLGTAAVSAAPIYVVSDDGVGVAEAENFSDRVTGISNDPVPVAYDWDVVTAPVSGDFSNAAGGEFVQVADGQVSGAEGVDDDPSPAYVDYVFRVSDSVNTTGEWEVSIRAAGMTGDAASDSLHVRLFNPDSNIDFTEETFNIHRTGVFSWKTGIDVNGDAPLLTGDWTIRILMREDAAALDKVAFYRVAATPDFSGEGPPESALVPEPASLALIALGGLMMIGRGRRD